MKTPSEFDDIRPFESEELPEVYDRLLASEQFQQVLNYLYPNVSIEAIGQKMHQCETSLEFQKAFAYPFLTHCQGKHRLRDGLVGNRQYEAIYFRQQPPRYCARLGFPFRIADRQ